VISTSGAVEAGLARAGIEAGAPLAVISGRACADESTSGGGVVARGGVEARVRTHDARIVSGVAAQSVVSGHALAREVPTGLISARTAVQTRRTGSQQAGVDLVARAAVVPPYPATFDFLLGFRSGL